MLEQRIRQRAYDIYLARLRDPALFDWLQAEGEVLYDIRTFEGARRATREPVE
jgi:hypothetical protein